MDVYEEILTQEEINRVILKTYNKSVQIDEDKCQKEFEDALEKARERKRKGIKV